MTPKKKSKYEVRRKIAKINYEKELLEIEYDELEDKPEEDHIYKEIGIWFKI